MTGPFTAEIVQMLLETQPVVEHSSNPRILRRTWSAAFGDFGRIVITTEIDKEVMIDQIVQALNSMSEQSADGS